MIPPGHGEDPAEGSLALCAHTETEVVGLWVECRRCGRRLRPITGTEDE